MSISKLYFSLDMQIAFTFQEWIDVLDLYSINEISVFYYSVFDSELRAILRPYVRGRIVNGIIEAKKNKNKS